MAKPRIDWSKLAVAAIATLAIGLILAGHYATERPAVEELAEVIGRQFPGLNSIPSSAESDPLRWSTR